MRSIAHNPQILSRMNFGQVSGYNSSDTRQRLCYEVWEYDNYADEHFFHNVYMSKSTAYKEVRRLKKQHANEGGDHWNYWWILELTIFDHNNTMKEIGLEFFAISIRREMYQKYDTND